MKHLKITLAMFCAALSFGSVAAQTTIYDANRVLGSDLNGTARYVGMGGAMGALGGDITTMGTNPAGIGIYRSSDVMVSFGLANNGMKTNFMGNTNSNDKFFGSFDNAGFVYSYKIGNQTPLRFVNFGFNYRRTKSFDRNSLMQGVYVASQTEQMADMTNNAGVGLDDLTAKGAYSNSRIPWLGILGYDSYLMNPHFNEDGSLAGYNPFYANGDNVNGVYNSRERGGLNEFDFNVALNFYDRIYLGATLGVYYLDYTRNSNYSEDFSFQNSNNEWMSLGGYTLNNHFNTHGSGVDFKLGIIARPFEDSPFRIGLAVHTPTYYRITEYTSASLDYDVDVLEGDNYVAKSGNTYTQDQWGNDMQSETVNKVVTPWRYNFSLGYTISNIVAIGAEYEYADYTKTKLKYDDDVTMSQETQDAKDFFKGVSTFKVGAEFKLAPEFSFRVGYNHITAGMKDEAFKWLPSNSVRTDTEYSNLKSGNNYTFGLGYRGESFYVDLAYQYNTYKEKFYAFDNKYLEVTDVINRNNKVMCTIGMRF